MVRTSFRELLRLAIPVVLGEIAWSLMGTVDTLMAGHLGTEALGAVGVGTSAAIFVTIFGIGLLLGMDALVSQAFGAGLHQQCGHTLKQGLWLAALLSGPLVFALQNMTVVLEWIGVHPAVQAQAAPFLYAISWETPFVLAYSAFRRFLQGQGRVRIITFALVSANLVNVAGNWALMFGHLGFPKMGVVGSGWSTTISGAYLALVLAVYAFRREGVRAQLWSDWRPDPAWMRKIISLGLPAASQITLEVGAFSLATFLAGKLDPVALGAHHIALRWATITFMVPLGISSAGSVAVGQAIGRGEPVEARRLGWLAIGLGAAFMACAGTVFALFPRLFVSAFTTDPAVIALASSLLGVAAIFQFFDGTQVVTIGVLRGAGDTRTPMLTNVVAYWIAGLPLGWWLCFQTGLGVYGIWIGLSLGLILVALILLPVWHRRNLRPLEIVASATAP